MGTTKRHRVSPEDVVRNAAKTGGGRDFFKLPKGVRLWDPEKAGSYEIDILPYETKSENHPDKVSPGAIWWKMPFMVHRNVGPSDEAVVCPTSIGKKCPICEERSRLKSGGADNEALEPMNFQRFCGYNLRDPDDEDGVVVMAMSHGKFQKPLAKEIAEGGVAAGFFDVTDSGQTLKVRFSDATFEGRKYLEATRFDCLKRKEMDEDEVLAKTVCLEEALDVLPYDRLKALFFQIEDEDAVEDTPEEKPREEKLKAKREPEPEPEEKPKSKKHEWAKGDKVQWKLGKKTFTGEIFKIVGDEARVMDANDDKHEVDLADLQPVDDEPEPAPEPEPEEKGLKVGDKVVWDDGNEHGEVVRLHDSGKKIRVKDAKDEESWQPTDEVKLDKKTGTRGKEEKKADKPPADDECPHGHEFGKDCDKFPKDCEHCKVWAQCDTMHEQLEKRKTKK